MEIDANKILSDVRAEWAFWFHNGTVVRNIYELLKAIESASYEDFVYHVNDNNEKNDFALWIEAVLGDKTLADSLHDVRDRKSYAVIIQKRIKQLERMSIKTLVKAIV